LNALNKTINNLKEIFRNTGGSYADVVKQLDSVEVEIKEINLNTTTIENRHNVGELALEEYRKQLTDLERRKEKAETKINGLMLRLRGEIR
jgi:chromosome segregation ATPase